MSSTIFLDRASAELHCAADQAEARAQGNPLDPWSAMAATVRLLAAAINPLPVAMPVQVSGLHEHFTAALQALDQLSAADAPLDLPFWRAHVADLSTNAQTLDMSRRTGPRANS
jgi:hypothetical protein